jgi:ketosteroid isomerase-like protein
MKKSLILLTALFCLIIITNCQQKKEAENPNYEAEVCELISQNSMKGFEAWQNEDLETYMSFLAPDFINMFSYGMTANLEECREQFQEVFDNYVIKDVKYERIECIVHHDMAFETGLFEQKWISNDGQDTIAFKMRGMNIYKKQEDGSWKWFRLMGQQ